MNTVSECLFAATCADPEDDLPYTSVPLAPSGTVTVRYSKGEDSSPLPYPVEAE